MLACCCLPFTAHGQSAPNEAGRPFIRHFTPKEIGSQEQYWGAIQDRRGVMYFGGNMGVAEYDGVSWRHIGLPGRRMARSFAIDAEGRVHVGSQGEIGYLAADATGQMQFVSLLDKVPAEHREFADVWKTVATPQGVYFLASQYLFRWSNGQVRAWRAATRFSVASSRPR